MHSSLETILVSFLSKVWALLLPYIVLAFLTGISEISALGAIFSATDSVCTLQVLSQDETPFLYSLVFGEGVVNDATSVVLFNAIQNFDLGDISTAKLQQFIGNFLYLFSTSTILGVAVSCFLLLPLSLLKLSLH